MIKIDFDPEKSQRNANERGLPFDKAIDFDWSGALYMQDNRNFYPESRFIAMGYLDDRLHVVCFTPIKEGVRIISFRKANLREIKHYEKETTD